MYVVRSAWVKLLLRRSLSDDRFVASRRGLSHNALFRFRFVTLSRLQVVEHSFALFRGP